MRYIFVISILFFNYFSLCAQKDIIKYNLVKTEGYGGFKFASPKLFLEYMGMNPFNGKLQAGSNITIRENQDAFYIILDFITNPNSPFLYKVISYEKDETNATLYFKTLDEDGNVYHFLFNDKEHHVTRCPDTFNSVMRLHYD